MKLNIDSIVTQFFIENLPILKSIHPNIITLFGLMLNGLILLFYTEPGFIFYFILFLRYLSDCLDGGVARAYNKSSVFGGFLDTASDNILLYIAGYSVAKLLLLSPFVSLVFGAALMVANLLIMFILDALFDHKNMKTGHNIFHKTYSGIINNSFILFVTYGIICANL